MKKLLLILIAATTLVSTLSFAFTEEEPKPQHCTSYCGSNNMDGTGGTICQIICSK